MISGEVLSVRNAQSSAAAISRVVDALTSGQAVVAPTETRYALMVRADSSEALAQITKIKGRPGGMPSAIFMRDLSAADAWVEVNPEFRALAERFLPGPLTVLARARRAMAPEISKNGKVGIRISSSPVIQALTKAVSFPLTATSANLTGETENETISEIVEAFGASVALYLDGGKCSSTVSTVVDSTCHPPRVLREGAISEAEILKAANRHD